MDKDTKIIIVSIIIVALVIGAFFGYKAIYNNRIEKEARERYENSKFAKEIDELNDDIEEVNKINKRIEKRLKELGY